jgi:hypothetical protein
VLSGFVGSLCCVMLALLWGYCVLAVYRLRSADWWIVLISLCIISVSAWLTFSNLDLAELYRAMGYSERQIDIVKQFSFLQGNRLALLVIGGSSPHAWVSPICETLLSFSGVGLSRMSGLTTLHLGNSR